MAKTNGNCVTYEQFLDKFRMPDTVDKVKVCPLCQNYLHLLQVTPYVWFWVHHGEDLKRCADANIRFHKPVIANNVGFYLKMTEEWNTIVTKHNRRVKKQHECYGSAKDQRVPEKLP